MAAAKHIQTCKVNKTFPFELDDTEKAIIGEKAGKLSAKRMGHEVDLALFKKEKKEQIDALQVRIDDHLNTLVAGKEQRAVDCDEVRNFKTSKVSYMHKGKSLLTRDMSDSEKQMKLMKPVPSPAADLVKTESKMKKDMKDAHKEETSKKTKKSSLDKKKKIKVVKGAGHDQPFAL